MSTLGPAGSNAHNPHGHVAHPGLTFPLTTGIRRGYGSSHSVTPPKPSPTPQQQQQHQSPYQSQQYAPQPPQQATYSHHMFPSSTSSPVPSVSTVQNGTSRHAPSQAHGPSAVGATRQRGAQPRQMNPQMGMSYSSLQHAMKQSHQAMPPVQQQQVPQQVPQQVAQQVQQVPQIQPLQQAHQPHQAHPVQQQVQQVQPVQQQQPAPQHQQQHTQYQQHPQQPVQQQQPPQSVQHVQQPQQGHQPNDGNLMSRTPPNPQVHAQNMPQGHTSVHRQTHQKAHPQSLPQIHQQTHQAHNQSHQQQAQAALQAQPTSQAQTQLAPPPQSDPIEVLADAHNDDTMELDDQDETPEDDSQLSPRLLDAPPFVPRTPMGDMMSAPPEGGSFESLDAVHKHVLSYCTSVGYAVVIGRSKKTVPGLKKVLFVCDRAGKPPARVAPEQRKRKTSSRKCNCQFGFFAIEQRTQWTIRYRPDQAHLQHNHGPSASPLLHPAARKLDSKMVAAVKQLKESGIGVSQTLEILQQQNPHVPLLPRDIYNARAAINRNPSKVEAGIAEERPAIYSKPAPTAEERIRSDLRRELQRAKDDLKKHKEESKKEIDGLKEKLGEAQETIKKFEMFIDICNERVMIQRRKLADSGEVSGPNSALNI